MTLKSPNQDILRVVITVYSSSFQTEESLWKMESDYLLAVEAKSNDNHKKGSWMEAGGSNSMMQVVAYFNSQMFHMPPLAVNILSNTMLHLLEGASLNSSVLRISVTNHPFDHA